jgi:hypothetical protein
LYQLPLDEFTEARNTLAKELGQEGGSEIRKLAKPPVPAWAVNQLYWGRRKAYDALVAAASALRNAHAQVLAGKRADLRAAGTAHEEALDEAVRSTIEILNNAGQPPTDSTKQAVINTLRALPATGEAPGRLARTLMPGGFELLAGLPIAPGGKRAPVKLPPPPAPVPQSRDKGEQRARALAKAKEAVAEAQRIEKTAEQQSRREEFEAARAAREAERASQKAADAREALESAQAAADEAENASEAANRKKDAAARRARESADTLARARVKTETAQAELARLQS